jgi:hypothetical protein
LLDDDGLRISKPGKNVLTAGSADLMFDSVSKMVQVIHSGVATNVSTSNNPSITWPALGFVPFVWFYGRDYASAQFHYSGANGGYFRLGEAQGRTSDIYWAVLNIPRGAY